MENPFKTIEFRNFIIRIAIYVLIGAGISILSVLINGTDFSKNNFDIPPELILEAPSIRTIIINSVLLGIVAFIIISREKLLHIKIPKFDKSHIKFIILTVLLFLLKYYYLFMMHHHSDFFLQNIVLWGIVKILLNISILVMLAFAVFGWKFIKYFFFEFKDKILLFIAICVSFFILMLLVQNLWTVFSGIISKILFWVFSMFFDDVTYRPHVVSFTMAEGGGPLIGINDFRAIVGKPCSGIDSFLLFTSLYALIFFLDYKRLKKKLAVGLFFVGAIGMFIVNLLRIFLLFIVGAFVNAKFAIGLFHGNIGWILFIMYFFIFWHYASKYVYKDHHVHGSHTSNHSDGSNDSDKK